MDMPKARILVVEDEELMRWGLVQRLAGEGYRVSEAGDGAQAMERFSEAVDLVLLDYRLPDTEGLSLLRRIKQIDPEIAVVLMTAHSSLHGAVEAMREGAFDYLGKPFDHELMLGVVRRALETNEMRRQLRSVRSNLPDAYPIEAMIGGSPAMTDAKDLLRKVAQSPASTVLLTGESGTGKDLAAKIIHFNSKRVAQRFVNITCSALPEHLLESELFGHERGAFTDAKFRKKGLLELADGGTVFLDEIGEMPPSLQAKLLRFLEDRSFNRVGGSTDIQVNARIIAATNRDLAACVRQGSFRQDLYYRLHVLPVKLPALRERVEDIPLLVSYFIDRYNRAFHKNVRGASRAALQALLTYPWPGNVRELRNAMERCVLLAEEARPLQPRDFQGLLSIETGSETRFTLPPEGVCLEDVERHLVVQALERTAWNQSHAGRLLGLNRDQIRYRIRKFGLGEGSPMSCKGAHGFADGLGSAASSTSEQGQPGGASLRDAFSHGDRRSPPTLPLGGWSG